MKIIYHDLSCEQFKRLNLSVSKEDIVVSCDDQARCCIGCFGCWLKTPGKCILPDAYQQLGEQLSRADELLIVSRCSFGSYSSTVKNMLDRSISYISPFFEIRKGEMHHRPRYHNTLTLSALFYGSDITPAEQETARALVGANALNLNGKIGSIQFMEEIV